MKVRKGQIISCLLGLALLAAAPITSTAQNSAAGSTGTAGTGTPQDTTISSLDLEQADIRDALKILFKNVGVSYVVAADVQGNVTVSLHNIPFETALQNILKQVDATYRIEGGVYSIVKSETDNVVITTQNPNDATAPVSGERRRLHRIKILHADPQFIYTMLLKQFGQPFGRM